MKERLDFFNAKKSFVNFTQFCLSKSRLQIRYCIKLHESKLQDFFYYLIATRFEFARSSTVVAQEVWSMINLNAPGKVQLTNK